MLFLKYVPRAPLADLVEYLWLMSDAPAHTKEAILPTGTLELVINLRADRIRIYDDSGACRQLSGTVISGAYSRPFTIDTAEHALAMGVHFRPGGALPLLRGIVPGELADGHVDAELLWNSRAGELREHLCEAVAPGERFQILEAALLAQATRAGPRSIVQFALQRLQRGGVSVADVVASIGVSHRHFASAFRNEVGMTPKTFSKVQRLQRTIAALQSSDATDWASVASEQGYYDQAHMIHEFVALTRSTPVEFLRQCSCRLKDHHVLIG